MPVIKVSQSSLEELIELVQQRPEIYNATHPDHKDAVKTSTFVLGVGLVSDWVNQYSICTHSTRLFPHTFRRAWRQALRTRT